MIDPTGAPFGRRFLHGGIVGPTLHPVVANRLVEVVEQQLDNGVVGIAIAVVAGGEVTWSRGFGRVDVDRAQPVTTGTVFSVQSVTKSVVATALMQWVERGEVGLDDPVNRHLDPVGVTNDWEERSPITIRRLLTHTAGLPIAIGPESSDSLEDMVAHHVRAEAEPGTRLIYANSGYDVLGYLLGRLAGTTWERAVTASVLEPLGMTATADARAENAAPEAEEATGHVVSQVEGTHLRLGPPSWPYYPGPPSGALVSTVEDLARFLIAHLSGGAPILSSGTIADMHRLHASLGAGGGGMGLGFRVDRRRGRPFFCHAGDGFGFTTFIGGHPEERVGVALLMNTGGAQEARSTIIRAALDSVLSDSSSRSKTGGENAALLDGGYRSTYWGVRADVADDAGEPVVTTAQSAIAFAESVSRLTRSGGRWRADGGMFDGCELDFDTTANDRRFYGGLYPFEFVADDTNPVALPSAVDEAGNEVQEGEP